MSDFGLGMGDITGSMIMSGNEEAWIDMMLEDKEMLEKMGLSSDLPAPMKEQVKQMLLSGITDGSISIDGEDEFVDTEPQFDESKSPAEQFINEAMSNLGMEVEVEAKPIFYSDMKEGGKYILCFPNGNDATVILKRILPNSFGDDYVFENIKGAENLVGAASPRIGKNEFPLPAPLLAKTEIKQI